MLVEFWDSLSLMKRLYDRTVEPVCLCYGIARMELDIILFLANNPGFDTAKDIVERRRLTKSHVSVSIKSLERRRYLEKVFYKGNNKTAHLRLLSSSEEIVSAGQEAQKIFSNVVFQGFSREERAKVGILVEKIVQNVREELKEVPVCSINL